MLEEFCSLANKSLLLVKQLERAIAVKLFWSGEGDENTRCVLWCTARTSHHPATSPLSNPGSHHLTTLLRPVPRTNELKQKTLCFLFLARTLLDSSHFNTSPSGLLNHRNSMWVARFLMGSMISWASNASLDGLQGPHPAALPARMRKSALPVNKRGGMYMKAPHKKGRKHARTQKGEH